jgi:hypothetical protein
MTPDEKIEIQKAVWDSGYPSACKLVLVKIFENAKLNLLARCQFAFVHVICSLRTNFPLDRQASPNWLSRPRSLGRPLRAQDCKFQPSQSCFAAGAALYL